ncbi:MAG: choice-of-anchor I family protein [Pseudomonadota bacterium]
MFTLQILHASDLEGGVGAIENAPNFAAIVDALEQEAAADGVASILLSAGDNFIPGPFFNAGGDFSLSVTYEGFYNEFFELIDTSVLTDAMDTNGDGFFDNDEIQAAIDAGLVTFDQVYTTDVNGDGFKDYFEEIDTNEGRIDVAIMNALGIDASAVGNHEFDAGSDAFENIINYDSEEGNGLSTGRYGNVNYLQEVDTPGVQFPYLSANLDFSNDFDVGALFTDTITDATDFQSDLLSARDNPADPAQTASDSNDPKIAPATIVDADGEQIGVVGATTQVIESISSTGNVTDATGGANDMAALAAVLQPVIDDLIAQGIDKIIIVSHLQQIALETELAGLLNGVDVIIAGGSDTLLADSQDRLRSGDTADADYPIEVTNADGDPALIVSTEGEYSYVGRLVVTFDDNGVVIPGSIDENESGAFATDAQGVRDVTGETSVAAAIAGSEKATDVQNLANAVTDIVTALDADIAGESEVFLNGERQDVRTQETNMGNLTADANLVAAKAVDDEVLVSFKNGGGIRAPIGSIVDQGDGTAERGPTAANPVSGKQEGEISELDIDNALRFDNGLVIVELSPEELKIILEHAVAGTAPGATPGQFAQVGGLHFSFDPDGTAQELGPNGTVVTEGTRIQDVSLVDENGVPTQLIIDDGMVTSDAPASIKVVTLDFLAGGGDGYPFEAFSAITDLGIGEQQALSDFLTANHGQGGDTPFAVEDTDPGLDGRIQNLDERGGTVDAPIATQGILFEELVSFVGEGGEGASEVVAHEDGLLYVTNGEMERIDIFDIAAETQVGSIPLGGLPGFDGLQSVAVKDGVVAAAISREAEEETIFGETRSIAQPGFIAFFDADTLDLLSTIDVGNLPDQIVFSEDGNTLLVAGEGEKNADSDHDNDPLGTVGIIDVTDPQNPSAQILNFANLDGLEEEARDAGIRLLEGASISEDLEPEYIAISPDGTTAFVALQENNAIAKIDLQTNTVVDVFGLGTVDFSNESKLDPLDNGVIDIRNVDNLVGLRMPDSIASFEVDGQTYVITANEGDSRDDDEDRVGDLAEDGALDPALLADLKAQGLVDDDPDSDIGIERLEVSTVDGDTDGDGDIDVIHTFSSRSFSIFDSNGNLIFDSGSQFEEIVAELAPGRFNDDDGDTDEDRSDAKGPEPEAITVGEIDDKLYAFIGLERDSGIMIYDITDPANAFFVNYIPPIFPDDAQGSEVARQSPEIVAFIEPSDSTTGNAQIAVSYEVSGTTVVFDLVEGPNNGEDLVGTNGDDLLVGGDLNDNIKGLDGDDRLLGRAGDDELIGGRGDDFIFGNEGDDEIYGGRGDDEVLGGLGDDEIYGLRGDDSLDGHRGDDEIYGGIGNDTIEGGFGEDFIEGDQGTDTIFGDQGKDAIDGGNGDDFIDGGKGFDALVGRNGDDIILGARGDDAIAGGSGNDFLYGGIGEDVMRGNAGDDFIRGGRQDDEILGDNGDDSVFGGLANDIILGGRGEDALFGDDGRDLMIGEAGDDTLRGGNGRDVFLFDGDFGDDTITDANEASDTIEIIGATAGAIMAMQDGDDVVITVDAAQTKGSIRVEDFELDDLADLMM